MDNNQDSPCTENPVMVKPDTVSPCTEGSCTESHVQINTKKTNIDRSNTNKNKYLFYSFQEAVEETADGLAFYDALTKPQAIKDFYENEELIAITKELADTLRKNRTVDWQKRESARAKMRMIIKRLLKRHKYPPEGMEDAVQTVMSQCELWADNQDMDNRVSAYPTD